MRFKDSQTLSQWFLKNRRILPWRQDRDPYRIWISEVMLQQTTVAAVVPYYEKFLRRFPSVASLAAASSEDVLEMWAGLGYYSRARNLHRAAQAIQKLGEFPQKAESLLALPGFGPYTSRAVASLAFGERVGVLDGNVIRVLSRRFGLALDWWKSPGRRQLQALSDELAMQGDPWVINQALMELGATVCTAQSPVCRQCPWRGECQALQQNLLTKLPRMQPRRASEIWIWRPQVHLKSKKVALAENQYAPFLKGQWLFPGIVKKVSLKPKKFDVSHSITHHQIFVQIDVVAKSPESKTRWVSLDQVRKISPTSLVHKILQHAKVEAQK